MRQTQKLSKQIMISQSYRENTNGAVFAPWCRERSHASYILT